ncbi:SDR family oxidoreductase [Lacipirellula limnantheis]|uniref:UDP-glucose 4-epimerase n=1 Tax=Lacipirellula limnantheis TaxID=2528024 RepID=A0A517U0P5_9BACT|nr:SDR family oxidoreductase [Lacipirellula limnantheis]QDT74207.1 UDP-glucose 4-epimerase [Lacipirellula limnantheis]
MKYLVTGGAGFIGSHLATALVERGDEVRVFDNLSTGKTDNLAHLGKQVELVKGDLLDAKQVEQAVAGVDVVFHQAAMASVPRSLAEPAASHAACATGTLHVLDAARRGGVKRVVYAGSSSAYGNQPFAAKRESDLPAPLSPYAAAKLAGEAYCQAFAASYGLETVVIRYFNVFGPRQDPNGEYSAVIPKFVVSMLAGKRPTVFGDGGQSRDFTYVENVVRGNLAAAAAPAASGRIFNVACGRQYSLLELIESINRVLGTKIEPIFAAARVGDVRDSLADITAARETLAYEPTIDFDEGLRRSIEYYKSLT